MLAKMYLLRNPFGGNSLTAMVRDYLADAAVEIWRFPESPIVTSKIEPLTLRDIKTVFEKKFLK
jgi:hypothetical protein